MQRVYYCGSCPNKNDEYICVSSCFNYDLRPDFYLLKNGEYTIPLYKRDKNNNDFKAGQEFKETSGTNDKDVYTLLDRNRSDFDNFGTQYITNIIIPREKLNKLTDDDIESIGRSLYYDGAFINLFNNDNYISGNKFYAILNKINNKSIKRMKCHICGGTMILRQIKFKNYWGVKYKIEDAEAYVCSTCGEMIFSGNEVKRLQKLAQNY